MYLISQDPVRLLSVRAVKFTGTEGKEVKYNSAKILCTDEGVVIETVVDSEIADKVIDLKNVDGKATFQVLQDLKNKPKLRLVDFDR